MSLIELTQTQQKLFQRLNQHVRKEEIKLANFWKSPRLCLTFEQFQIMLQKIGFYLQSKQIESFKKQNIQFVNLEGILTGVKYWNETQVSISNFISKQLTSNKNVDDSFKNNYMPNDKELENYSSKVKSMTSNTERKFFKQTMQKQIKKQLKLNQTLIKAKNESDYELTIKVGEANDICKKTKNGIHYIIDSSHTPAKVLQVNAKNGQQVPISLKVFQKKHQQLKLIQHKNQSQIQGTLEEDLKKVMVQVMFLSSQLEEQIRLIELKGISH